VLDSLLQEIQSLENCNMGLTDQQRAMIEQKKAEAMAKKQSRSVMDPLKQQNLPQKPCVSQNNTSSLVAELNKAAAKARQLASAHKPVPPVPPSIVPDPNMNTHNIRPITSQSASRVAPTSSHSQTLSSSLHSSTPVSTSAVLSEQQKRMMEEKRKAALAKKMSQATPIPVNLPTELRKMNSTSNFYQAQPSTTAPARIVKGACSLVSKNRFEVNVGFHDQLIQTFKCLESAQYNAQKKIWSFDIMDHDRLIQKIKPLQSEVHVSPLPNWTLQTFKTPRTLHLEDIDITDIEPHLYENLMPFQKEGIQYGVSRKGRVLIADDMGLGKTVQALGLASYYRQAWPVLIVCPSSVRFSWEEAIIRWLPSSVSKEDITVINKGNDFIGSSKFIIISYDLISKKNEDLTKKNFKFIILDESHSIKDHKSGRTKAIVPLLKESKYLVLLSGTPALSRPIELFSQLQALDPALFRFPSEYGNRYCDGKMVKIGTREVPNYQGSSHMDELALILKERCMIRRLKSDVLQQLPSKQRCLVVLDPAGVDTSNKIMKEKKKENEKNNLKGMDRRAFILGWYQDTATAKLKAVSDYIKDLVNTKDQKFLVFGHHKVILHAIKETLEKLKIGYIFIDGSVCSADRKECVDKFQTQDTIRVAVLSIMASNSGLTLTAAQLVVFAELFWNPGILTQAEDRAHRIGQTDSVVVQYLVARETADDVMWPMIQKKLDVLNKAGLSKDNFEESEAAVMEDTRQHKIDAFFQAEFKEEDVDQMWGDLTDEDFIFNQEVQEASADPPAAKRMKS